MSNRTPEKTHAINRFLQSHGLGRMEESGTMSQLGFLVKDHEHFRSLVARCEPEERSAMYNTLAPNLRFQAHPLDWYIARSKEKAEADKLPTIDGFSAEPKWQEPEPAKNPAPVSELLTAAQNAVNIQMAKHTLTCTCMKCTCQECFTGDTKYDAMVNARLAGWSLWTHEGQTREVCPDCPVTAPNRTN